MTFVLRLGSTSRTLAEWGIVSAALTKRNQDADELQFTIGVQSIFADTPFAYGGVVQLFRGNGARIFRGTVNTVRASGAGEGGEERITVTCLNAWWDLSRIIYQQPRVIRDTDFASLLSLYTSHVTLGQSRYGHIQTTNAEIVEIAQYALLQSAMMYAAPTIDELVIPPIQEARDITCAEAIRRMLAYTPDAICWFDYSPTVPIMWIQRRSAINSVSIDIAAGTVVGGLGSLTSRPDLVPAGVVFNFITQEKDPADPDGPLYPRPTQQVAGAAAGPGVIFATIELSLQGGPTPEPVPALLAESYYAALSTLHWEGTITLQERVCTGLLKVGDRLNLTNGKTAWATMGAVVQQVTEDLIAGTTEATLGPPEHLGPQDFVALMERWRLNRPTSDFPGSQHNGDQGFGDVPPNPDVEDPSGNEWAGKGGGSAPGGSTALGPTVDIPGCEDGNPVTFRVQGLKF